jgi:hypothetical protein
MSREVEDVDVRPKEWLVESAQRMRMSRLRSAPTSFSASSSASVVFGSVGAGPGAFSLAHHLHHRPLSQFIKEVRTQHRKRVENGPYPTT